MNGVAKSSVLEREEIGTRIVGVYYRSASGHVVAHPRLLHDAELDFDCEPIRYRGAWRCLPRHYAAISARVFADVACTQRVVGADLEGVHHAQIADDPRCANEPLEVRALGVEIAVGDLFDLTEDGCQPANRADLWYEHYPHYYAVGRAMEPGELASFSSSPHPPH